MKLRSSTACIAYGRGRRFWVAVGIWALVATVASTMLLLGAGCTGPTETREDTFHIGESPMLVVNTENGAIEVNVGPAGTIHVEATLRNAPRVEYQVDQDGDTVTVDAQVTEPLGNAGADITVTVPTNTEVDLVTSNGSIEVHGIEASGLLHTSNGKVVLDEVKGDFDATTSNGDIEVTIMEGIATLRTSNGSVTLVDVKGTFDAQTSNGPIAFSGEMTAGGENRLQTSSGRVTVQLQGTLSVELDASTTNGQVTCTLPILALVTETEHLVGTIGDGEAELIIRTSNGDVTIE